MYTLAMLLVFPFSFMLLVSLLAAAWEAAVKWFNSPSKRKERKFLSATLRGDWR